MEQPLAIAVHSKAWDSTCKNNAAILPTHAWENGHQIWSVRRRFAVPRHTQTLLLH